MSDRRQAAATAGIGAGLVAGGGVMRHVAVERAFAELPKHPKVHAAYMLKPKVPKKLWLAGHGLGLLGAAPLAVGAVGMARGKVEKDDKQPLWREGLKGTSTALAGRTESLRTKQPHDVRATQVGASLGAGALGGLAVRGALRHHGALKPVAGPIAGVLAGTASIPLANRLIQRKHPDYQVTATGVKRKLTPVKRPGTKSFSAGRTQPRNLRSDVGKADRDYLGRQISYRAQRAAITGAGLTPGVGSVMAARQAGKYAPPGQQRRAAARQFTEGTVAGTAAGVGGAYAGAELAHRSARVAHAVGSAERWKHNRVQDVRAKVGWERKAHDPEAVGRSIRELSSNRKMLRPLGRSLPAAGGAVLGYHALKNVVGQVGAQRAITANQHRQERYNSRYHLAKALSVTVSHESKAQRHDRARLKRVNAGLATTSGMAGLTSLGLLAARKKGAAVTTGILGSGVGGTNALIGAAVQRREAKAIDPVSKALAEVAKRQSVEIRGSKDEHKRLIRQYGDRGPLPAGLDRDTKMKAYEARYVHAGGDKSEKWNRRANAAEGSRNAALATGTAGLAGLAALRHPRAARMLAKHPRLSHRIDTTALAAGAAGGASELYGEYARHKRASYANSPGGVARSALTRMRAYSANREAA